MIKFTLKVLPLAINDIQDIYDWYENKQTGLGEKFLQVLEEAFDELKINPFYQVRYQNVRCRLMNRFPYMIHFSVNENTNVILIGAILNTGRGEKARRSIGD